MQPAAGAAGTGAQDGHQQAQQPPPGQTAAAAGSSGRFSDGEEEGAQRKSSTRKQRDEHAPISASNFSQRCEYEIHRFMSKMVKLHRRGRKAESNLQLAISLHAVFSEATPAGQLKPHGDVRHMSYPEDLHSMMQQRDFDSWRLFGNGFESETIRKTPQQQLPLLQQQQHGYRWMGRAAEESTNAGVAGAAGGADKDAVQLNVELGVPLDEQHDVQQGEQCPLLPKTSGEAIKVLKNRLKVLCGEHGRQFFQAARNGGKVPAVWLTQLGDACFESSQVDRSWKELWIPLQSEHL